MVSVGGSSVAGGSSVSRDGVSGSSVGGSLVSSVGVGGSSGFRRRRARRSSGTSV